MSAAPPRLPADITAMHLGIFDLDGIFRHKRVEAAKAEKLARDGYSFCEVLHAWDSAERTWSDTDTYIDRPCTLFPETLRRWPFAEGAGVWIADFDGEFGEKSPRNQLLRQLERAADMGVTPLSAFEFEFFLLQETPDSLRAKAFRDLEHYAKANRTYSLQSAAVNEELFADFTACMTRLGIGLDSLHTELGPGCFEAPLKAEAGVKAADDAALFKNFAKAFFLRRGLTAAFLAKLRPDLPGQSGHFHISLRDAGGTPLFADPDAPDGLSELARHFLGGVLALMPEMLALPAHTVNAYRRMVPGAWSPTWASWGVQNRTCAVRVITDTPEATRLEFRVPAADTNPHATMAFVLAAGLHGIETGATPPPPQEGSAYLVTPEPARRFPRDLHAAADRLEASDTARALFGDAFVDHLAFARRHEALEAARQVTEWELRRYLEIL
ncbi:glutamine synthetase [Paroceanicella profunda]|uniref:Glutamine synthetase n=1 Tax=Paroceanicella profunda TaxID=2579971 RepID=A0A5B8FWD2_9RHOB|nr:glutamine synthetase family protein [Paroceanicella profunda]QDL91814.1 glutamine synthetase [Paroceanicella profunda]